jgi:hypothetical protein
MKALEMFWPMKALEMFWPMKALEMFWPMKALEMFWPMKALEMFWPISKTRGLSSHIGFVLAGKFYLGFRPKDDPCIGMGAVVAGGTQSVHYRELTELQNPRQPSPVQSEDIVGLGSHPSPR